MTWNLSLKIIEKLHPSWPSRPLQMSIVNNSYLPLMDEPKAHHPSSLWVGLAESTSKVTNTIEATIDSLYKRIITEGMQESVLLDLEGHTDGGNSLLEDIGSYNNNIKRFILMGSFI